MARRTSIGSRTSIVLVWLAAMFAVPAVAQDPRLEDLIPDSALSDPEGWAAQAADVPADAPLDPSSPMDEGTDITVEWPDDLDLPELVELPPDESIEFAEPEVVQQPLQQWKKQKRARMPSFGL